jgi:hypothetical protein
MCTTNVGGCRLLTTLTPRRTCVTAKFSISGAFRPAWEGDAKIANTGRKAAGGSDAEFRLSGHCMQSTLIADCRSHKTNDAPRKRSS